jgi:flotillin
MEFNGMEEYASYAVYIGITFFIVIAIVVGILKNYRLCPSDKILVIYGKGTGGRSAICVHGGAAFVWPIIQNYQYLDLTPFTLDVELCGALSKQNIRVDVSSSFTVAVSTDGHTMQNAAERLLGLDLCTIQSLVNEIIRGELRLIVTQMDVEELNTDRERFIEEVRKNVESELRKIGLRLINAYINDVREVEASKLSVA